MATVSGILNIKVDINATKQELLEALAQELGFPRLLKSETDAYYKLVSGDPDRNEPAKLVRMENWSYHGTPSFEAISEVELNAEKYECIQALLTLKQYI